MNDDQNTSRLADETECTWCSSRIGGSVEHLNTVCSKCSKLLLTAGIDRAEIDGEVDAGN